jgi:DNA-binding NtrC family response regulator
MLFMQHRGKLPEGETMRKKRILLVDDDPHILTGVSKDLESEGYEVTTSENGKQAIAWLEKTSFDVVITDLVMQPMNGIDVLKKAKALNPETKVIVLTGYGDMTSAIDALRLNADDYLLKPCEPEEIHFRVLRCLEKLELDRKLKLYETMLPVCCSCKKIRDDSGREPGTGEWMSVEKYVHTKAGLEITSTYCPECAQKFREEFESG